MILDRYHGLGNDYLVLVDGPAITPGLARAVCDRHTGAGGDGLLEPVDAAGHDAGVRIWNPDGSVAEKSGNGLRIHARWLVDTGRLPGPSFTLWTGSEAVRAEVSPDAVTLEMGTARFDPAGVPFDGDGPWLDAPLSGAGHTWSVCAVGMGNPHCVVFVDRPVDEVPWRAWGAALETHPAFPRRTNVQIARVLDAGRVEVRIHERGAGPTLASGSSACAVVAAAVRTGRLPPGHASVCMQGGEVGVTVTPDYAVTLRGTTERIGRVDIDDDWLVARRSLLGPPAIVPSPAEP